MAVSFPIPGRSPKSTVRKQAVDDFIDYFYQRCIQHGLEPEKEDIRKWFKEKLRCSDVAIVEEPSYE